MLSTLRSLNDRFYESPSLLLGLCGIFWAGNAIASRLAVGQITPLSLVFLRWVLVLSVLWPIYGPQVRAHWPQIRPKLTSVILMGALGFTAFNVLFYLAGHYTTALNIGILQGALPIFVMMGAFFAHGTRVTLMQVVGVLITSVGVLVIATHGAPLAVFDIEFNRGDLLMLAACVLYAFYAVALRKRPQIPGPAFFTLLALIAAVTSLPLILVEALDRRIVDADHQGPAGDGLRRDLPVVPGAALLHARRRPDRTRACGDIHEPGAGVHGDPGRDHPRRAVRDVPPRRAGAGHLRHPARAVVGARRVIAASARRPFSR